MVDYLNKQTKLKKNKSEELSLKEQAFRQVSFLLLASIDVSFSTFTFCF